MRNSVAAVESAAVAATQCRLKTGNKFIVYSYLCFLAVNPLAAQTGFLIFPGGVYGMSLMQWFQGAAMLSAAFAMPKIFMLDRNNGFLLKFLILLLVTIFIVFAKSLLVDGYPLDDLVKTDVVEYIKYAFFAIFWFAASCLVKDEEIARKALLCIIAGAMIDAAFKIGGYVSGAWTIQTYVVSGIYASAGSEGISAKATTGFLITAMNLLLLFLRRNIYLLCLLSAVLIAGVYGTFDRSAQVALLAALAWGAVWLSASTDVDRLVQSVIRCVPLLAAFMLIYFMYSEFEPYYSPLIQDPLARWTYELESTGTLGSGRAMFYESTWEWLLNADVLNFMFGQGYSGTREMLYNNAGMAVHTHSDFFDMMSFGGAMGMTVYAFLFYCLLKLTRRMQFASVECLVSYGIIISFAVMSFITGQLTATHTMISLTTSLWCLYVINESKIMRGPAQAESVPADIRGCVRGMN